MSQTNRIDIEDRDGREWSELHINEQSVFLKHADFMIRGGFPVPTTDRFDLAEVIFNNGGCC